MDPLSVAFEVVPLAGNALKRFLARNEVRHLYRVLTAELRKSELPPGTTALVIAKVEGLRSDPTVAGALAALLAGDSRAEAPLRKRVAALLTFADPRLDSNDLADMVVNAIVDNLWRAKRDDRAAAHLDAQVTQEAIRDLKDQLTAMSGFVIASPSGQFGPGELLTGCVCRISQTSPEQLGVDLASAEAADETGHLTFIHALRPQEQFEEALRAALTVNDVTVIVLRGSSGAGKTRLAYESSRQVCQDLGKDAWVVAPRQGGRPALAVYDPAVHRVLDGHPGEPVILWLDDVEMHIGSGAGPHSDTSVQTAALGLDRRQQRSMTGLTRAHLDRLRNSRPDRPLVVVATAGGKGYRTHEESTRDLDQRVLGREIDAFVHQAHVKIRCTGRVDLAQAEAAFGAAAVDEIKRNGIGSYALRSEVLETAYLTGLWPSHKEPPSGAPAEGQALADGLLAWKIACSDQPVALALARKLWQVFRPERDVRGPADDRHWDEAIAWGLTPPITGQRLVPIDAHNLVVANDHLLNVCDPVRLVETLHGHRNPPGHLRALAAVEDVPMLVIGSRLHFLLPDIAAYYYQAAIDAGDAASSPVASLNLGHLRRSQGDVSAAAVAFQRAVESGHSDAGPWALVAQGSLEVDRRAVEAARTNFDRAVRSGHVDAGPYASLQLGDLLLWQADAEAAYAAYKQAVDTRHADWRPWGLFKIGRLLADADAPTAARWFYGEAARSGDATVAANARLGVGRLHAVAGERDEAAKIYREVAATHNPDGRAWAQFLLALLAQEAGDTALAQDHYAFVVSTGHKDAAPEASFNLGLLYRHVGDVNAMCDAYEAAIRSGHREFASRAAFNLGIALLDLGKADRAIAALERAFALGHPDIGPDAAFTLGTAFAEAEDFGRALEAYQHAVASGHREHAPRAAVNVGGLLSTVNPEAAAAAYETAIASGHSRYAPAAAFNLARLHEMQSRRHEALTAYRRAIGGGDSEIAALAARRLMELDASFSPDDLLPSELVALGELLASEGNVKGAAAVFEHAMRSEWPAQEHSAIAAMRLGMLAMERADVATAQAFLQQAVASRQPAVAPVALLHLGALLERSGDRPAAIDAYRQVAEINHPDASPDASVRLGMLLVAEEDADSACAAFARTVESGHPHYAAVAAVCLGNVLRDRGDMVAAFAAYQLAIDSGHPDAAARAAFNVGTYLLRRGKWDGARSAFQLVLDLNHPELVPMSAFGLGAALKAQGANEAARISLRRASESADAQAAELAGRMLASMDR